MAYVSQDLKKQLAPAIKAVLKKYNMKGSIGVRHHSTLVVNLKAGEIDFANSAAEYYDHINNEYIRNNGKDHYSVNEYHIDSNWEGTACEFLEELKSAMMTGNHNRSDLMTDYHDVGWYIDINVGQWNKAYQFTGASEYFDGLPISEVIELTLPAEAA